MTTLLMLDFDGALPAGLSDRVRLVARVHRFRVFYTMYRRTRRGWHVVVALAGRVALMRVIALQAILGSDWKRELYNSRRALRWRDLPPAWRARVNVLYTEHTRGVLV